MLNNLKPCPFCGGAVEITQKEIEDSIPTIITLSCRGCGMIFKWTQHIEQKQVRDPISGEFLYLDTILKNESIIEIWNRRAEVKHGKWIINRSPVEAEIRCSECGYSFIEADPNAEVEFKGCPMCLAIMDEKEIYNV